MPPCWYAPSKTVAAAWRDHMRLRSANTVKAYLAVTAGLFGLLVVVHVWRMVVESSVATDPWFLFTTLVSALLCGWGARLLAGTRGATPGPR